MEMEFKMSHWDNTHDYGSLKRYKDHYSFNWAPEGLKSFYCLQCCNTENFMETIWSKAWYKTNSANYKKE